MKPLKITSSKLNDMLSDQYNEANSALQLRLPSWLYMYDCWRGIYRDNGYYNSTNLPKGLWNAFGKAERLKQKKQEYEIYFREIFKAFNYIKFPCSAFAKQFVLPALSAAGTA